MKVLLATAASIAALASVTTAASAHGHRHHHHRSFYGYSSYKPVYVVPSYSCKWVYRYGHAEKVCFKVYH